MTVADPIGKQLVNLQAVLAEIAARHGFRLTSPFADRHGAWQCRFVRGELPLVEAIGIACESTAAGAALRCEISAAVNTCDAARSERVRTIVLNPSSVSKGLLRSLLAEAEIAVAELRMPFEPPPAAGEPVTLEAAAAPARALVEA